MQRGEKAIYIYISTSAPYNPEKVNSRLHPMTRFVSIPLKLKINILVHGYKKIFTDMSCM